MIEKFNKHGWNSLDNQEQNTLAKECVKFWDEKPYKDILLNELVYKNFGTFFIVEQKCSVGFYSKTHKVFYKEFLSDELWLMDWQEDKFTGYCYDFSFTREDKE